MTLEATGSIALPIAVECWFTSSVWHFEQICGPTYFASFLLGRQVVTAALLPPALMTGSCARELNGQVTQTMTPARATKTTMTSVFLFR